MISLRIKAALVGSPFEIAARTIRQAVAGLTRNLELAEIGLEETRLPAVLAKLIGPQSNIVDAGCHIGSFLSLAYKIAPCGQHIAIEPSPAKAKALLEKFRSTRIEQVAICDRVGFSRFEDNLINPAFSRLIGGKDRESTQAKYYDVKTTTLDALDLGHIDLVKLDIEGSELAALRGGRALFARSKPYLIFECGAESNEGLDRSSLFEFITEEMNYSVFTFADFLYAKGPLGAHEFRKCGIYPFRAFNFIALSASSPSASSP